MTITTINRAFAGALALFFALGAIAADKPGVVGSAKCAECHEGEHKAWQGTHHYRTFEELHRRDAAKVIQKKLGIRRLKSESACMSCHYTTQVIAEKASPISGISCESCHGPAEKWMAIHNDYGGKTATKETETAEARAARWKRSEEAGMIRPSMLYALAANCYACHTVPNEKLVNEGGHKAGSNFELVAWLQGEVRHNYLASGGKKNAASSPERLRKAYVVGKMLDLEFALRGVAGATQKASYAVSMAKRTKRAALYLKKISKTASIAEVDDILKVVAKQKLKLNNGKALTAAADQVATIAKKFAARPADSELAKLDVLLPKASAYKGSARP